MHGGVADNEYEIESILYDETFGSKTMYLVKWKNYPMDQCTWEPYRNLTNCQEILNEYRSNRIVVRNIYSTDKFKKLHELLMSHTEQELIELMNTNENIPVIDSKFIMSTIAYLTTLPSSNRSEVLMKFVRHNLLLIELSKKRTKQQFKLEKWQNEINSVSGFEISVVNTVDFEGPPKKFNYVDECVAGNGVEIPNDPPFWCYCKTSCSDQQCHFSDLPVAYNEDKRVKIPPGSPIYECNSKCPCDSTCHNRVVQNGPGQDMKLQIFRTDNHRGWGVKTLTFIRKGTYVTKFTGEVITRSEADERAVTHGSKSTYMFDLDYNTDRNDSLFSIDATKFGNVSHFFNHSCDANLASYAVWIDCYDTHLPTLALFTTRDIREGEDITLDYMTSVVKKTKELNVNANPRNVEDFYVSLNFKLIFALKMLII